MLTKFARPLISGCLFFSFFASQQLTNWYLLRASNARGLPYFVDLKSVLNSANCSELIGWKIYDPELAGDCGYIYGSLLIRLINFLHVREEHTLILGWIMMILLSVFFGFFASNFKQESIGMRLLIVTISISPPIMLLVERGNIDILVVLLIVAFAFLLTKEHPFGAFGFLILASLIKFYPVVLFAWVISINLKRIYRIASFGIILITTYFIILDLGKIKFEFPRYWGASFGNPVFALYLQKINITIPEIYETLIGFSIFTLSFILIWTLMKKGKLRLPDANIIEVPRNFIDALFSTFSIIFLACYFAGTNFDYRLVYLIIPALIYIKKSNHDSQMSKLFATSLFISVWCSYNSHILQIAGDLAILFWVTIFCQLLFKDIVRIVKTRQKIFGLLDKN